MKKYVLVFVLGLIFISCKQDIKESDLSKLNGYWEIEKAIMKDGEKKEYKVNPTIDFFEVKNKKGFRQKVMPQFNGTFQTNNIKELVTVTEKDGDYYLNYVTPFGKWKEAIVSLQDSVLVLQNDAEIEYHYKRHIPFTLK